MIGFLYWQRCDHLSSSSSSYYNWLLLGGGVTGTAIGSRGVKRLLVLGADLIVPRIRRQGRRGRRSPVVARTRSRGRRGVEKQRFLVQIPVLLLTHTNIDATTTTTTTTTTITTTRTTITTATEGDVQGPSQGRDRGVRLLHLVHRDLNGPAR